MPSYAKKHKTKHGAEAKQKQFADENELFDKMEQVEASYSIVRVDASDSTAERAGE